jgi:hypothetical protein
MRQILACDIRKGMVVRYREEPPIAVAEVMPGFIVTTLLDSTGHRVVRVPYGQTVTYLHMSQ